MASREIIERACIAHTPQWDRMDETIKEYARQQMSAALDAALPQGEDVGGVVEIIKSRVDQEFDGEAHFSTAEALSFADLIASLSAKVAEVERERDEARLSAQAIGDQLGQDIDRLTRSLAAAEARASELQREVERLSVRAGRLEKALRTIADWRDHDSRPEDGELEAFARAALQQEGESDDQG